MTPEEESDEVRALLREAHRHDEQLCPPFERLLRKSEGRQSSGRSAPMVRAAALAAVVAAAIGGAVWLRRERPSPTPPLANAMAWTSGNWEGPLDFLLRLPGPPPFDVLPALGPPRSNPPPGVGSRGEKGN